MKKNILILASLLILVLVVFINLPKQNLSKKRDAGLNIRNNIGESIMIDSAVIENVRSLAMWSGSVITIDAELPDDENLLIVQKPRVEDTSFVSFGCLWSEDGDAVSLYINDIYFESANDVEKEKIQKSVGLCLYRAANVGVENKDEINKGRDLFYQKFDALDNNSILILK